MKANGKRDPQIIEAWRILFWFDTCTETFEIIFTYCCIVGIARALRMSTHWVKKIINRALQCHSSALRCDAAGGGLGAAPAWNWLLAEPSRGDWCVLPSQTHQLSAGWRVDAQPDQMPLASGTTSHCWVHSCDYGVPYRAFSAIWYRKYYA